MRACKQLLLAASALDLPYRYELFAFSQDESKNPACTDFFHLSDPAKSASFGSCGLKRKGNAAFGHTMRPPAACMSSTVFSCLRRCAFLLLLQAHAHTRPSAQQGQQPDPCTSRSGTNLLASQLQPSSSAGSAFAACGSCSHGFNGPPCCQALELSFLFLQFILAASKHALSLQ